MAMVTIAGVVCPDPSTLKASYMDISTPKSGRDECGDMHKMIVTRKRKFELMWRQLSPEQARVILNAAQAAAHVQCTLYDIASGADVSGMYTVGDREFDMQMWTTRSFDGKLYKTVSLNLIEV